MGAEFLRVSDFAPAWQGLAPIARIAVFLLVWLVAWLPLAIVLGRRLGWQFPQHPTPAQKLPLVLSLYAWAPALLWAAATLSRQSWQGAYGWFWTWAFVGQVVLGLGLGLGSLVLLWGLARSRQWLTLTISWPQLLGLAPLILLVALIISSVEELVFRGFLIGELGHSVGGWAAIALANLLFALLHLPWEPLRTGLPQLPGLWVMGLVLSVSVIKTGDLGLAVGLHGGWVWAIASLDAVSALQYTDKLPTWVMGHNGNLTAGLLGIGFLSLMGAGLWAWP